MYVPWTVVTCPVSGSVASQVNWPFAVKVTTTWKVKLLPIGVKSENQVPTTSPKGTPPPPPPPPPPRRHLHRRHRHRHRRLLRHRPAAPATATAARTALGVQRA